MTAKLELKTASGGKVILDPTDTAVDRTLTLPATGATLLTDSAGILNIGSGQVYKDASGNVGIGTSSPASFTGKLVVNTGTNKNINLRAGIRLAGSAIQSIQDNAATDSPLEFYTQAQLQLEGNPITFYNGGERARIDSAGNVGIGTSSPSFPLTIARTIADQSSFWSDSGPTLTSNFGNVWSNYQTATSTHVAAIKLNSASTSTGFLTFHTNGANERARITSDGNLLVGTTSAAINSSNFGVNISAANQLLASRNTTSAVAQFYGSTGENRFLGTGAIQNTLNSYGAISDIKLKENIVDATPKLDKLNQVRIVNFNLIGSEQKQIGVVAQELEQIFPSMVDNNQDEDSEGNPTGETTKSVKYSVFVPMLIKAIQEIKAELDTVKAELNTLKGN